MSKIIGIDLGTTNSVVAVMEGGEPTVISSSEGGRLYPSVVAVNPKSGERMVGQVARRQAVVNPENTIFSVKRFMGRKFDDAEVQRARKVIPYEVTEAPNGDLRVTMGDKKYSPPEISAMILQKIKSDAEKSNAEAQAKTKAADKAIADAQKAQEEANKVKAEAEAKIKAAEESKKEESKPTAEAEKPAPQTEQADAQKAQKADDNVKAEEDKAESKA